MASNQSQSDTAQNILLKFFRDRVGRQRKGWGLLYDWLGHDEFTAKHRLAGRRDFSPDDIVKALRGELGGDLLAELMGDANPAWYAKFKRQMSLGAARREIERQRKLIEKMELDSAE